MHWLYLTSVWLHVVAATAWVGGMLFLSLILVPSIRDQPAPLRAALVKKTALRFRKVGWLWIAVLVVTGFINAYFRGVTPLALLSDQSLQTRFGHLLAIKVGIVAANLSMGLVHDFYIGPRASELLTTRPGSPEGERFRRIAMLMGRTSLILGLVIIALAVSMIR